jgi:hypothetical protein
MLGSYSTIAGGDGQLHSGIHDPLEDLLRIWLQPIFEDEGCGWLPIYFAQKASARTGAGAPWTAMWRFPTLALMPNRLRWRGWRRRCT